MSAAIQGARLPVTARLSKKFYERFGDDIAGEFVDWFNAVDSTYQQQLRDLNDLNWERFKAELHSAIAQSEARMIERMAQLETRLTERMTQLETRVTEGMAQLETRVTERMAQLETRATERTTQLETRVTERMTQLEVGLFGQNSELDTRVSNKFSEMMKWMFIYWSGTVLSLGGLMIALLRK